MKILKNNKNAILLFTLGILTGLVIMYMKMQLSPLYWELTKGMLMTWRRSMKG